MTCDIKMDSKILISDVHYLNIQESFKNLDLSVGEKKITRSNKEKTPELSTENNTNRRFSLRPRKRPSLGIDKNDEDEELVNIYNLENKKPKLVSDTKRRRTYLETIFEEPVVNKKNGSVKLIGTTKVKRSITFNNYITKTKEKKRKDQIKKLVSSSRSKRSNNKFTLKDLEVKFGKLMPA